MVKSNRAVRLKKIVQLVDVPRPGTGTAMDDLGQIVDGSRSDVEEVLSFEVAPPSFASDGGESRSTVLGKNRFLVARRAPPMDGLEAAGRHDRTGGRRRCVGLASRAGDQRP